jgi:hypothetical protein
MQRLIYILVIFTFITTSCEKNTAGDCFKSTGAITIEERTVSGFHTVLMKDNVTLILVHSDKSKLQVEAGSNLLDNILTEVNDSILTISNLNSCNWVRDYSNPVNVYLDMNQIDTIQYRSSADLICSDTIRKELFQVDVYEGSGTISLIVHINDCTINLHAGTADVILNGITINSYFYQNGYGRIDGGNCKSRSVFARNWGSNNLYLSAEQYLSVEIRNIGNIYYHGNPVISTTLTGTGILIPY